ncbi:hypothetical protein NCCP2716_22560 [Sporosarcina sp. NCCP-2716]|uniref:hypothetical protein n=1 Tax=Sporosarcina sp. NCCP-2716 TaxID=2943679 RepID=UPI0020407F09|nr:hypothetical protein [Sporosarcina sp. NCCP-2716]GKV69758.1 hypothetical protein NCCP2716_22560 [Sporosarcina sp. NCCP-2716]
MKKKVHTYTITMANGEQFPGVRLDGPISHWLSGVAQVFLQIETETGQTVELNKYQMVKAELTDVEE